MKDGMIGEMLAAAWLMEQGYEVYRGLSPSYNVDLIARRSGEALILIDVKEQRPVGGKFYCKLTKAQREAGVRQLQVHEGQVFWLP